MVAEQGAYIDFGDPLTVQAFWWPNTCKTIGISHQLHVVFNANRQIKLKLSCQHDRYCDFTAYIDNLPAKQQCLHHHCEHVQSSKHCCWVKLQTLSINSEAADSLWYIQHVFSYLIYNSLADLRFHSCSHLNNRVSLVTMWIFMTFAFFRIIYLAFPWSWWQDREIGLSVCASYCLTATLRKMWHILMQRGRKTVDTHILIDRQLWAHK